jgi:hypothetical protein
VVWALMSYNRLVRLRNQVDASWAQIDVQLKRRHDLIPNLVETVRGYAAHERATLGRLFALAEAYPDLKAGFRGRDYFEAAGGERGPVQVRF